ncbi:MAG: chromosome segregation protein SMC, partial [Chloroflexi bacterium]
ARRDAEGVRARAEAAVGIDAERVIRAENELAALVERERAAQQEMADVSEAVAEAVAHEAGARMAIVALESADAVDRRRLAETETLAAGARSRLRLAEERLRAAEVAELESRLGLETLREGLLVELAGLGDLGLGALHAGPDAAAANGPSPALAVESDGAGEAGAEDPETVALTAALAVAGARWATEPPVVSVSSPARIARLRRHFHELGAANPSAVEEHAAIRTRLEGLEAQESDLRAAIVDTRRLIDELSALVTRQFRTTFQALESAFDARFRQLFDGGFARLTLTDPSDLSATGVEIVARPPGKKAQALAMLSGGERALTAVALLFAMLQVRPVPFCVLDEVDAALDEANIGRFVAALRSLADRTQFIVITHNRGTIEAADALYGVTVGDDSVSRVISLRLDEASAVAAEPGMAADGASLEHATAAG